MTEEQALEKWCPFARVMWPREIEESGIGAAGINRRVDDNRTTTLPAGTNCIGSRCMAWRVAARSPEFGRCGLVPVAGS
jgi:hypothetical protein